MTISRRGVRTKRTGLRYEGFQLSFEGRGGGLGGFSMF